MEKKESKGIQSIEVGIEILQKVAESKEPLSITELAIECNTTKSKLHRYLISFIRTGMLEKDRNGRYVLGKEMLRLGLKASYNLNIVDVAHNHLMYLKEKFNQTTALAMWGSNGPFFASWEETNGPVNIGIKVGSKIGTVRSIAGAIFAHYLPTEQKEEIINREIEAETDSNQVEKFWNTVEFIKDHGYGYVHGTLIPGISAVAAPIFNRTGQIIASLNMIGVTDSLEVEPESELVKELLRQAEMISQELGWME